MGFLEEEFRDRRFPSEWELDELEKKQKESKRRNRRKGTPSLTEEEERLDNRDAWALQEDLTIVTLSRIIVREMYNDLGFLAGNRLLVLVEAQSSWSANIVVRFLMYLGETYRRYIEKNDLDLYTTKKVELPKPELYVVYTGDRKMRPERISLKREFFGGEDSCVEVEAKVIYDSEQGDILNQFITFSKVFDQMRQQYPDDTRKAVQETIRICQEKDVLSAYLSEEEAATVMFTFADQEREYNRALRKEREEGEAKGILNTLVSLVKKQLLSIKDASEQANMSEEEFIKRTGLKI